MQIRIEDDEERQVRQGDRGRILIRGQQLMRGYIGKHKEDTFVQRENEDDDWLPTGDCGYMTEQGELVVCSRIDVSRSAYEARGEMRILNLHAFLFSVQDIIVKGGKNIDPALLESVAMQMGIDEVYAVGIPSKTYGQDIALVVKTSAMQKDSIRSEIGSRLGPLYRPAIVLHVGEGKEACL